MASEKRLIDANALKERAIRVVTVKGLGDKQHCYIKAVGTNEIDKAPTVDAVEVVRCKDCKHCRLEVYPFSNKTFNKCSIWKAMVRPDDFCSYGERREGE